MILLFTKLKHALSFFIHGLTTLTTTAQAPFYHRLDFSIWAVSRLGEFVHGPSRSATLPPLKTQPSVKKLTESLSLTEYLTLRLHLVLLNTKLTSREYVYTK